MYLIFSRVQSCMQIFFSTFAKSSDRKSSDRSEYENIDTVRREWISFRGGGIALSFGSDFWALEIYDWHNLPEFPHDKTKSTPHEIFNKSFFLNNNKSTSCYKRQKKKILFCFRWEIQKSKSLARLIVGPSESIPFTQSIREN
jgi:hypothetical protein